MLKRLLSLVIVITLILCGFNVPSRTVYASAAEETSVDFHFHNHRGWTSVYLYWESADGDSPDWPGVLMQSEGDNWYGYTISGVSSANVTINNNTGRQSNTGIVNAVNISGEKWYSNGALYDEKPSGYKVNYFNLHNWVKPHIYYYSADDSTFPWPGAEMQNDGNGWYSYTIYGLENPRVIFNNSRNGTSSTQQCPGMNEQGLQITEKESWIVLYSVEAEKPLGTTVHFYNLYGWAQIYMYYYQPGHLLTDAPGAKMTHDGGGWYSYTIYGVDQFKVTFSDTTGTFLPGIGTEGFTVSGDTWLTHNSQTDAKPEGITVNYYNKDGWEAPKMYFYVDGNYPVGWPGVQMTDIGNDWYSYTIYGISDPRVIFTDGSGTQYPSGGVSGFPVDKAMMYYLNGAWYDSETDTDMDGLADISEIILGTDKDIPDSDGDGLPDGYEFYKLLTDPKSADSDGNGADDGDEDADEDGIMNLEEYMTGTNPHAADTDEDGLTDFEEIYVYASDPLHEDTDGDTLSDGDDVTLGFSPLFSDSDGNGIPDCDEKIEQTLTEEIECGEKPEISGITVSFEGNGNINTTTEIKNIYNIDVMSSRVAGLIGAPVEISSSSSFDAAEITFTYDESALGDTQPENLAVLWYDEEAGWYTILDGDTVVDPQNHTVSCTTTHFSKYMVVDKQVWFNTWRRNTDYAGGTCMTSFYDFAFVVDTSGSMAASGIDMAKTALNNFVSAMKENDNGCLISFNSTASLNAPFGSTKMQLLLSIGLLNAGGGTSVSSGLTMGVNELLSYDSDNLKAVILICDGDVDNIESIVTTAIQKKIKIFAINVVGSDKAALQSAASRTGGQYYYAVTSDELLEAFSHISGESSFDFDLSDGDNDGLPDTFETNGIRIANGDIIYTDPNKYDTDGDGLSDGYEMGVLRVNSGVQDFFTGIGSRSFEDLFIGQGVRTRTPIFFNWVSNPNLKDSDGDGEDDKSDPDPLVFKMNSQFVGNIEKLEELAEEYYEIYGLRSNVRTVHPVEWLVFMFIRQFDDKNVSDEWDGTGGAIDRLFVNYVFYKDKSLYKYFEDTERIGSGNGGLVDVHHWAATSSALVCISSSNSPEFQFIPERHLDNLAGWAGDIQQMMGKVVFKSAIDTNDKSYQTFYDAFCDKFCEQEINGQVEYGFSEADLYADTDAYNIVCHDVLNCDKTVSKALMDYYSKGFRKRFTSFTEGCSKWELKVTVRQYTDNYYYFDSSRPVIFSVTWPLLKKATIKDNMDKDVQYIFSSDQSNAAADAFADLIIARRDME